MRIAIIGAGAVGGVIAGRLFQAGVEVAVVARGPHLAAMQARGLRLETPEGSVDLPIPAFPHIAALRRKGVMQC